MFSSGEARKKMIAVGFIYMDRGGGAGRGGAQWADPAAKALAGSNASGGPPARQSLSTMAAWASTLSDARLLSYICTRLLLKKHMYTSIDRQNENSCEIFIYQL
jgi:hypothetical protein